MTSSLPPLPPLPPPPRDPATATPQHRHSHQPTSTTPRHNRDKPRRKSVHSRHRSISSASSPEVITNLVDSLSKLSPGPLENPALYGNLAPPSQPISHRREHPGYDYTVGAGREHAFLHPDDAALAPVVRTAKPPSGLSVHTNGSIDSGRSSYSGISVGKGGVDIPNYVRNYMNGGVVGPGKSLHERKSSRESGKSSKKDCGRLGYVSSKEKIKMEKALERDRESEGELRMSAAGILSPTGGIDTAGKGKNVAEDISRHIPQRSSSYGKGSPHTSRSYPPSLIAGLAPMHAPSPLGSPLFEAGGCPYEDDENDEAAPAPELPKARPEKAKRNSKQNLYPLRSDSLRAPAPNRSPSKNKRKSDPAPRGAHLQASPPRASFHSTPEQRPSSADSVDDAVDAYLCSERLSQKIRMPNTGRIISFSEVGDPAGFAVFVCVGMGLTRYVTAFYDELALTLGLRLITPDRPGVGESEPIDETERTVLNWPDDVLYICQHLKISKFSILAHSAGAIYALATALRMPSHIRGRIHLLAPWIPPSQMEGVVYSGMEKGEKVGSVPTSQRILRALPTPILKAANSSFMSATSSSLTTSLPRAGGGKGRKKSSRSSSQEAKEKAAAAMAAAAAAKGENDSPSGSSSSADATKEGGESTGEAAEKAPEMDAFAAALASVAEKERQMSYDERLTHAIWTLSTRNANPAVDLLVCLERNRPVGFRYVDITRDVVIHHGTKDTRVPVENVRWLGKTMKVCEVRVLPNEGHGLMASAMVMGGVLDEIATEWREWKKSLAGREEGGGTER
ncbi:alpha/beta-hydrolase, partial [Morchella conica CCBAS932]